MGLKNLSKVCHIDKIWVVISMVPKTTSLRLSRRVSVAKLVKRSSSRTKQYMSVSNYFYFFPKKKAKKGHTKNYRPKSSILDLAVANWRYMHIYKLTRKVPVLRTETMKYLITTDISEHPDISDTTHLGSPNLCINNSRRNRYTIEK